MSWFGNYDYVVISSLLDEWPSCSREPRKREESGDYCKEDCQDWLTEALRRGEGRIYNRLGSMSRTEPGGFSPGACGRQSFLSKAWQGASMLRAY